MSILTNINHFNLLSVHFNRVDFTLQSHWFYDCVMENTGVFHLIRGCVGTGMFFGLNNDSTLCHNIVTGKRISKTRSKDDIL